MNKREFLGKAMWAAGVVALPVVIEAAEGQRGVKEVTTASLTRSVLGLMDKAHGAGLRDEAEHLRKCAEAILRGGRAMVECDTDTDCVRKNGGDGYGVE